MEQPMRALARTAVGTGAALLLAGGMVNPASTQVSRLDPSHVTITNTIPLSPDIAFPLGNGGASIGGKPVGWSRAVFLTAQEAKRVDNSRCVFDLSYHVSNLGAAPAGPFSDLVRPVAAEVSAGTGGQQPAVEQAGLSLGPKETKVVRTEISLAPGAWFVVVKGDAGGQVKELEETGNNEGRFRATLAGTCDGTHWGMAGVDYRTYLLDHLIAKNLKLAGVVAAGTDARVHLDSRNLQPGANGSCLVTVDYQVENHGSLATQPFTSAVQVGAMPQPIVQQVPVAALAPGAVAWAHATIGFPDGSSMVSIHPVVVTSSTGAQQYGANGVSATVFIDGGCQQK
jgi:hypothetical protein